MKAYIEPAPLHGKLTAIPSKSCAHRLLLAAALADGPTRIACARLSEDIEASAACLNALGARVSHENGAFTVHPLHRNAPGAVSGALLDCGECGTTLRFLLPVVCALGAQGAFTGRGRLAQRPLSPLYEELVRHGAVLSGQGCFPLRFSGQLASGDYTLAANVSSQFIGGLLFALPLLEGDSRLELTGPVESRPYIEMTLDVLRLFGIEINVSADERVFFVPGGQSYRSPGQIQTEGDWSNAAFWLTAGALSESGIMVTGLSARSRQGDRAVLEILERFGARVSGGGDASVSGGALCACEIDASQIPDLVPVLSVAAAAASGTTVIRGAGRLRLKESDRLCTVRQMLCALGGRARETQDGLIITGGPLSGGRVDAAGDHRIAMAAAVASVCCKGPLEILGAEAVGKSYPTFFEDFAALGGRVTLYER